jgi:hypothetical protein
VAKLADGRFEYKSQKSAGSYGSNGQIPEKPF